MIKLSVFKVTARGFMGPSWKSNFRNTSPYCYIYIFFFFKLLFEMSDKMLNLLSFSPQKSRYDNPGHFQGFKYQWKLCRGYFTVDGHTLLLLLWNFWNETNHKRTCLFSSEWVCDHDSSQRENADRPSVLTARNT